MIVFHEGLPGSGKSYEACVMHIVPALREGRRVVTNIEGVNHDKFSEVTGVPVAVVKMLLVCVFHPEELDVGKRAELQKASILEQSGKDALIVIDEIQNLFPSGREKLSADWMRYITEHRHDGLDIILMGQDRRDCHNMWRRRIQRVITFTKQTALGRDGHYTWVAYEATKPEVYKKIRSGSRSYEKRYFGLYKSHTDGTRNTDAYADNRINIFKTPGFKYGVPLVLVGAFYAISWLWDFFTPEPQKPQPTVAAVQYSKTPPPQKQAEPVPVAQVPVKEHEFQPLDLFDELANKYRPRLAGVVHSGGKLFAQVDILSSTHHIQDSYTIQALADMGWSYQYRDSGLILEKGDRRYLVRAWPLDRPGRINNDVRERL